MSSPCLLVVGSTGTVGAEVVRALVERGARVRTLVRAAAAPMARATRAGVDAFAGDLSDAASLARALDGVDGAFFVTPHGPGEAALGDGFVAACEAAGVRRVVFSGAYRLHAANRVGDALLRRLTGFIGPHYRGKLAVEARVRRGACEAVVLLPSNFFQNDTLFLGEIAGGTYPQPLGRRGVNRVDCRDIGDAAARALLDDAVAPGLYPLVGASAYSGEACAAAWSAAIGRPVRYAGDDLATWASTVGDRMPAPKRADFAKTYRLLQRWGVPTSARALAATTALLGRPPRSFESWVAETSATLGRRPHVAPAAALASASFV